MTVGAWVYLVMAMVGWVGTVMEVVDGKQEGQRQEGLAACPDMPEHFQSVRRRH